MKLQEKINVDLKDAMKNGNTEKKNLLRVVIGEFNRLGKEISDDVATKEIKKMYTNAKDQGNDAEAEILNAYIPQEMDELELKRVCMNFIMNLQNPTIKDMGKVMGFLSQNYPNQYDGKQASTIVRELLK